MPPAASRSWPTPACSNSTTTSPLDDMLQEMIAMGLKGLEVVFPEHSPEQTRRYAELARRHMLLMTGGTDFHGDIHPDVRMGVGKGDLHVPYSLYEKLIER